MIPARLEDLRTVYSHESPEVRERTAMSLDGIAVALESGALHWQGNESAAERYMRTAKIFARMAAAVRGRID